MADSDALGRISLLVIIFALFYDTIFSIYKASITTFQDIANGITNLINSLIISWGGGSPLFPNTESLISNILNWEVFLFTNSLALAVIVFIDVIKMAFKASS